MLLNFIHYGDIQIEIRVSGINAQRLDEYLHVLQKMESIIAEKKPDAIFIPGDIFEYWDANGDETKMFSKHLHAILPHTQRIIIVPGNHDIRQKSNGVMYLDVKQNAADSIDSVVTAINNPKISYYKHSGLYQDTTFPITYAVWSQIDKWSAQEPKPNYNPWIDNEVPSTACIELFHDPIRGEKDFSLSANFASFRLPSNWFCSSLTCSFK
jgi:predicted MPP superfamily phosphohydrolase